jgi:hypothetical protein
MVLRVSPTVTRELAGALHVPDVGEEHSIEICFRTGLIAQAAHQFGSSSARVMLMTMGHAGYMLAVGVAISEGAARRARAVTRAAQQAQTVLREHGRARTYL